VDFVARAVATAAARHPAILGVVADTRALPFASASLDAIVCVSFLDRALFPVLARLLRPGGVLVYETFTLEHLDLVASGRSRGPSNASYLLGRSELPRLVAPLAVREAAEGLVIDDAGERHVARVVAVKSRESGMGGSPPRVGARES
jgi:SAM-dependent methyltransferase